MGGIPHEGTPDRHVDPTMRDYAALVRCGQGNEQQRLALLEAHRDEVLERARETERNLREIELKIATYRDRISVLENEFVDQAVGVL